MVYACKKCGKVYRHNGKWLMKHQIEKCHVMHLKPIELVEKKDDKLNEILNRIDKLESKIINMNATPRYVDDPIERIKHEESQKIVDPALKEYRKAFQECISELKEILKIRRRRIEIEESELELVMS